MKKQDNYSYLKKASVCTREIQLRREILAVMKLRASAPGAREGMGRKVAGDRSEAGKTGSRIRILAISDYEGLRFSREFLLSRAGYEVESVDSRRFLEVFKAQTFDIALICQSVNADRAVALAETLRRCHPRIHLVRITLGPPDPDSQFDIELEGFAGPDALLKALRRLVEGDCRLAHS